MPGFVSLVQRNRRAGYQARAIAAAGGPVCAEVTTNVLWSLSRTAVGQSSLTEVMVERMWDPDRGLFLPLARPGVAGPIATTIAALTPLALPDLPEEIGHRLAAHLLDPGQFASEVAPPSVSLADPTFTTHDSYRGIKRYWRGPTWVNTGWLCWLGLKRLGYDKPAAALTRGLAGAIAANGLREYYDPHTGAGMGARDFAWSALILEMLHDAQ